MKMKISSTQIIIGIVAFLVGVGTASYIMHGSDDSKKTKTKPLAEVMEEVGDETEIAEEVEIENTTPPAVTTTKTTTTTATAPKPSTEFVSGTCSTGLSAYKDSKLNAVVVNWSPCASDNFQFYKLVKSSKNSNPNYPADPVAFSSSNKNAANFVDKTVAARTTYYYKMCVVQRLGAVNCSGVASVSF